ncbi:MAG: hypothetical protein K2O18_12545 [Oscillospiraceae bacterium]|nr:hypothetical protein [Oscillospiraceae bacterium]
MNKISPGKQALSWLLAAAMSVSLLPVSAFAAEDADTAERENQQEESAVPIVSEDTEEDDAENAEEADAEEYISLQTEDVPVPQAEEDLYYLMNIPYDVFYEAIGTTEGSTDFDAVSSATNKVGNYGKSGGSFHSVQSAEINRENGEVTAVGGKNGAKNEGVTWPVKIEGGSDVLAQLLKQGGKVITEDSSVTVATVGRGQTSSSKLVSYEALNEDSAYSYFFLDSAPDNYLTLSLDHGNLKFEDTNNHAVEKTGAVVNVSYGTNWGDVQLGIEGVSDVEAALVNAVVIRTTDGTQVPLVHLYNERYRMESGHCRRPGR